MGMDNILDIYTKIKLRIGSEVIVSYYLYGHKITRTIILSDVCEFIYVLGDTDYGEEVKIDFFNKKIVIESIKVVGSNTPLYFNPCATKEIYDGFSIPDEILFDIKRKMLGDDYINFNNENHFVDKYIARDSLIEKYLTKDSPIKYDELFFSDKQKEEFEIFFNMLVSELSNYARKNKMNDQLKFVCAGTTSLIYEIGDKIIKIGKPRRYSFIPYCECILQPIINRQFTFDGYPIHVEVTQKVLALKNKGKANEYSSNRKFNMAISEIKNFLYSIGISMRDLHPGNIGILLQDNKIHYDGIAFDIGCFDATSIQSNNNLNILKKGKFVIIDLDCLRIYDIEKYINYLREIGYEENKATDLYFHNKCLVRR